MNSVDRLTLALVKLDPKIPRNEAQTLSREIFEQVSKLRKKFQPISEPHLNNFLVNIGVKEKGLCYQWSDALFIHFKQQVYPHFTFHLLVSDQGKYLTEHNVFLVTAKGKSWSEGILIDAWRTPGTLYFSKVQEDRGYVWKHRIEREIL